MLTKFSVKNFKQFKDEITFDLSSGNYSFNEECVKDKTVKTALIYGANASGKTNLGIALFDLVAQLTDNEKERLQEPFYKNLTANSDEKIDFEYTFLFDNKIVIYQYSKDESKKILNEKLYINEDLIIDYHLNKNLTVNLKGAENLNKEINSQQNLSALKYVYSNTSLDKRNLNNKAFISLMEFVNNILWYRNVADEKGYIGTSQGGSKIFKRIAESGNCKDFEAFLNASGVECSLSIIDYNGDSSIGFNIGERVVPFSLIASTGTMSLALFYFWWLQVSINNVPLLFVDEFDSSYHFKLSESIVKKLKELCDTQVILTTHNTNLLSNHLIRPDCGYVIDGKKIKSLNKCTERELRMAHNLERLYKAGEFSV